MSSELSISCFGVPEVILGQPATRLSVQPSALQLLLFLITCAGTPVPREQITAELWPDAAPQRGASRLTSALCRLRQSLTARHAGLVCGREDRCLTLSPTHPAQIDILAFRAAVGTYLADGSRLDLPPQIPANCGFAQPFQGWYTSWALRERLRLEALRERCLRTRLDRLIAAHQFEDAVSVAEQLLSLDPLLEDVHEKLIDCHIALDRPALAKRQFDRLSTLLRDELAVLPNAGLRLKIAALLCTGLATPLRRAQPPSPQAEPVPSRMKHR